MLKTREEVRAYALELCLPMLQKAAEYIENKKVATVVDSLGYQVTEHENVFRPFWGIAPVLAEEKEKLCLNVGGGKKELAVWLKDYVVAGVTPGGAGSWERNMNPDNRHGLYFQCLTELAGLFVGMFFARKVLWDCYSEEEKQLVADWTYRVALEQCRPMAANNHIWFPLFCLLVLKKFGFIYPETDELLREGLAKLDEMYLSDGWYKDGAQFGRFDYYEAWSMHTYPLLWCLIEDESFPDYREIRARYVARTEKFIGQYVYWFDKDGAHAPYGRSLAYRFAASSVFPLLALCGGRMDLSLAKTVMLKNISYFKENAALAPDGTLPAGYLYEAPALVENYTSMGGAYWCAKTFLCLALPEEHPFWQAPLAPLPIEKRSYRIAPCRKDIHLAVCGTAESGVTVYNNVFTYYNDGYYYNPFNDMAAYYNKFCYNSRAGFALSSHDIPALDTMIGLITPDNSLHSHRYGFRDLGVGKDGVMLSEQLPFANDRGTTIMTAILPIEGSLHLRLHRVTLSQPYRVMEGGFSLGFTDDAFEKTAAEGRITLENKKLISLLEAKADVPFVLKLGNIQPGLHLYAPMAFYPAYETGVLESGCYTFAVLSGIWDRGTALPNVKLSIGKSAEEILLKARINGREYRVTLPL